LAAGSSAAGASVAAGVSVIAGVSAVAVTFESAAGAAVSVDTSVVVAAGWHPMVVNATNSEATLKSVFFMGSGRCEGNGKSIRIIEAIVPDAIQQPARILK